jgi:transcription elongation factor Elf1
MVCPTTRRGLRIATICRNMVHQDRARHAAQERPPTCPKCGSHRTEIVAKSNDTGAIVVRCHSCGERSPVVNEVLAQTLNHAGAEAAN